MKTKLFFFAVVFMACTNLLATNYAYLQLEDVHTDLSYYYCATEYDALIIYRPENGVTDRIWETPDVEYIENQDSIIVLSTDQNGHWCFYSPETGFVDFFIYFVFPPYEPANFENENICIFSFSRILDAQNTESYSSYLWSTGATTRTISVDAPGIYSVTVTNACGNEIYSKTFTQSNPNAPNLGADQEFCLGGTTTLNPQSSNVIYTLWSTGSEDPQLVVSESGSYWVHVEDANGCNGRDTIEITTITTPSQEILLATINTDPISPNYGNNKITWDVNPGFVDIITTVNLYRESGTNNYILVGTANYTDGEWSDIVNSNGHSWKYKIGLVGTECGGGNLSESVQTIHCWISYDPINEIYTIQWDAYIIGDGTKTTNVTWYKVLSGNGMNELIIQDSVSGTVTSLTLPSTTDSIFLVGAELNGTKGVSGLALSNKTNNPVLTEIQESVVIPFTVYPNPATDQITINIGFETFEVQIFSMLGQVILTEHNVKTLNISNLSKGIYIISVSADGTKTNKRFSKN